MRDESGQKTIKVYEKDKTDEKKMRCR